MTYIVMCDYLIAMVTTEIDHAVNKANEKLYGSLYDTVTIRSYINETDFTFVTLYSDDVDMNGHGFCNVDGKIVVREIFER